MENNIVIISVDNLPYKKINGLLKSLKINPDSVAISISIDGQMFIPIKWQNYLIYSHKIKKIILLKEDDLFLFVGYSVDDETIVYNNDFSKKILKTNSLTSKKHSVSSNLKSTDFKVTKLLQINELLDKITQSDGLKSLSIDELSKLKILSKKL